MLIRWSDLEKKRKETKGEERKQSRFPGGRRKKLVVMPGPRYGSREGMHGTCMTGLLSPFGLTTSSGTESLAPAVPFIPLKERGCLTGT